MKKITYLIIFIFILINATLSATKSDIERNRPEASVDFQIRTVSYNGAYAPAHCLAIWVCDENDVFVRTLVRRAWTYIQHLVKWNEMTGGDETNIIITGASPNIHTVWNVNWDCKDRFDEIVPDGNYRIYVEFTEDNSLLIPVNGPWTMVEFAKGDQSQIITPNNNQFYQDIILSFNPAPSNTSVFITSPNEWDEISSLPFAIHFELYNFTQDMGSLNLFINGEFCHQHAGETAIPIYALPSGEVELALQILDNQNNPFDPPAEDSINILYNPATSMQDNHNIAETKLSNYPNPSNPNTTISFETMQDAEIDLAIYNIKGQKVKSLIKDSFRKGSHSINWNGKDSNNHSVASGVYYYVLKVGNNTQSQKMIVLK